MAQGGSAGNSGEELVEEEGYLQYDVFMLALCTFALLNVALGTLFRLDPAVREILRWADRAICVVFFADFLFSFWRASSRSRYFFRWGWIDLLSSIPENPYLRIFRVSRAWRLVRILRILRGARAVRSIAQFVLERRAQGAIFAITLLGLLAVVFGSIAILQIERGPAASIRSPADALWWAIGTITTTGYEDRHPATTGGRLVGLVLSVFGVALVGTVTGFLTAWFLAPENRVQESELRLLRDEIDLLRSEVRDALDGRERRGATVSTDETSFGT